MNGANQDAVVPVAPVAEPHVRLGLRPIPGVAPEMNNVQALQVYAEHAFANPDPIEMIEDDPMEDGIVYGPDERDELEFLGVQVPDDNPQVVLPGGPRIVATYSLAPFHRVFQRTFDIARQVCVDIEVIDTEPDDIDQYDWSDFSTSPMAYFRGKRNFHTTMAMVKDSNFNFYGHNDVMFVHSQRGVVTYRENDPACGHSVVLHYDNSFITGFSFRRPRNLHLYAS